MRLVNLKRAAVAAAAFACLLLFGGTSRNRSSSAADDKASEKQAVAAKSNDTGSGAEKSSRFDWPNWRGPEQNSTSRETGLVDRFDPVGGEGSNVLWTSEKLASRSTPIVMSGRLYTICRAEPSTPREGEKVVCADAATGDILWENRFNVYLSDVPAERVGWSCLTGDPETGNVYCLGVCGSFLCIDGKTGKTVWSTPLHEKYGLLTTYGGRTEVPVVFEDLVIISGVIIGYAELAQPNHRFLAFDKRTGEHVWYSGTRNLPNDTTWNTPVLTVLNGQAAMVFGGGDGNVWAFQPRTGKPIWHYNLTQGGINASVVVHGDTVFATHSEENIGSTTMGMTVALNGALSGDITKTGEIWRIDQMMTGRSSPTMVGDRLLLFDDRSKMFVVDPKTGDVLLRKALGKESRATPLVADGKIYCVTNNGTWNVLKLVGNNLQVVHNARLPSDAEYLGSPIVAQGRIYLPSTARMFCIGKKDHVPTGTARPAAPKEAPADEDARPAQVQVIPPEALVRPGQQQPFRVRVFNARGQLVKQEKLDATFALDGPGKVSADGTFTAASDASHTYAKLTAKVGNLVGTARIRVVPDLPWKFDFVSGEIPPTWVGMRYRHVIRKVDGNNVMVKITTIPKGTRSQGFMGHVDLSDYTIQADVQGKLQDNKMPDIGLIDQGYIMDLRGASQEVQLRTWGAQLRIVETAKFDWKPNVWYTMKLTVEVEDGKGIIRGKVWPKGEKEPAEWTATLTDPTPVASGSPGLFGNATDAEIFLDNITVTPNR